MSLALLFSGGGGVPAPTPQTVFPYVDLVPSFDVDLVINKAVTTRANGGEPQVAEDLDSQEKYFIREKQFTVAVSTDAEALNHAQWKVGQFKDPLDRAESITVMPLIDVTNGEQIDASVPREVGDRITVLETPPGFSSEQSDEYTIQYIEGSFAPGPMTQMRLKFMLWPAATVSFWVAGDATMSLAGVSTRPGY